MSNQHACPRPVLLCVLDGFGYRAAAADNAISVAKAPTWQKLWAENPHALLEASGEDVGLPKGQMGNSEVGHMNLGAGRVVYQDLPLIDRAIALGELATNPQLLEHIAKLKTSGGTCHVMGLTSPGGVHSHQDQMAAVAKIIVADSVPVSVHAFLDGRDVPPQSAAEQIGKLEDDLNSVSGVKLATV
jgi:2,3-bisphosphoglycerate-independent phosphoglycerate mutase